MFRIFSYLQVCFSGAGERSFLKKKNSNYLEGNCEGTGQLQASEKRKEEGYEEKRENGFSICLYEPVW